MLDSIKDFLKRAEASGEFKSWKESHKHSYLCSAFMIGNDISSKNWQLDFYDKDDDMMTSITEENSSIKLKEQSVFKKPKDEIKELELGKIKFDLDKAVAKIDSLRKKKFPGETPSQKIFVLQNLDAITWNITYINTSFNVLNVKINAINGKIIDKSLTSILGFKDKSYDKSKIDKIF